MKKILGIMAALLFLANGALAEEAFWTKLNGAKPMDAQIKALPKCPKHNDQALCQEKQPKNIMTGCLYLEDASAANPHCTYCPDNLSKYHVGSACFDSVKARADAMAIALLKKQKIESAKYTDRLDPGRDMGGQLDELPYCESGQQLGEKNLCRDEENDGCKPKCRFFRDMNRPSTSYCTRCETWLGGDGFIADECYASDNDRNRDILTVTRRAMEAGGCFSAKRAKR